MRRKTSFPRRFFPFQKIFTQLFPASGEQNVSLKAQGTITIYNAYSSSPQSLVATTRFVTPAGEDIPLREFGRRAGRGGDERADRAIVHYALRSWPTRPVPTIT